MSDLQDALRDAAKDLVDEEHVEIALRGLALAAQILALKGLGVDTTAHEKTLAATSASLKAIAAMRFAGYVEEVLIEKAGAVLVQLARKAILGL